jgi:type I restriction-modification system DNA methylase subunit
MELKELKPRKALNKAFLKVKPNRTEIEGFKTNLITLLDRTNDTESEEFHKNLVSDFLKDTYYKQNHFINTKGRNDLVIHNGQNANTTVGVILEAKKPTNKAEMISTKRLNAKAFQELVLYYLRERITHKNLEVKHLVATNINEWFIFDATLFDRLFAQNKNLVKQFNDFESGRLADTKTDFFYKQIAEPFIAGITTEIEFTYFNIQDFQKPLRNADKADDNSLIALFKLLSPEHLLKLPFTNDSNSLDKRFYSELLHIIGLTETKEGSKKLIERNKAGERNTGSILEDAIIQLDSLDKLGRLEKPNQFGSTQQEKLFNVALELSITWINRILFLKLLEAQLITYHKGDKSYSFLNLDKIKNYDDLNSLFFQVLARKHDERNEDVKQIFEKVPYLNSSLFEPTDLEQVTLFISNLKDDKTIPVISSTVLKDQQGKKRTGNVSTLEYLFTFLNAYDFSSEGSEEIQEDNKTLINASVLGLIFEKINGYKDGSFFTPGFITMYMCRETMRKAVVQKFNETKKWNCTTLEELYDKIDDRKEANKIVNSIKICDPAVGSGHFLVSALNEMIAVKNDLKILQDRNGKRLKEYQVEVVNDELIVTDEEGELFEYNPSNKESQRIQETLFHEKQTIIENCLFGVDINTNSVKICRLRLWIELLKNAYYIQDANPVQTLHATSLPELQTLPNIDINIKCGNSLVSRFAIDADLKQALKKSKWTIDSYRIAVDTYRNAESKEQKREMDRLIADIKSDFRSEISLNDPKIKKLRKLSGDLYQMTNQQQLFEMSKKEKADWNKKVQQLTEETKKLETEIEEIKANRIFENAFEWRFEFPEVLNDDGDFVGFDVVIGNPPYGVSFNDIEKKYFKDFFSSIHVRTPESFNYFWGLTSLISKQKGLCNFIVPSSFLSQIEFEKTRKLILESFELYIIINLGDEVFDDVATPTCIVGYTKQKSNKKSIYFDLTSIERSLLASSLDSVNNFVDTSSFSTNDSFSFVYKNYKTILDKCYKHRTLKDIAEDVATGVSPGLGDAFVIDEQKVNDLGLEHELIKNLIVGGDINRFCLTPSQNKRLIYCTLKTNINDFPNIENHLKNFKEKLEKRVETQSGAIPWFVMLRPRRQKLFDNPKILIRQTANRIIAAFDNDGWYCLKSGLIVQLPDNSDLHYYYLVALLNSKLFDFLYHDLVNEDNRIFPEVKPIQLFKLPIKEADKIEQVPIINLVEQINSAKSNGLAVDNLECLIDQLVYQLYDLTEDEIKIVENG